MKERNVSMVNLATDGKLLKINMGDVPNFVGNFERLTVK
jgi:hypothetical protein